MDRLEDIYREFCVMMTEDRIYENPDVGFGDICRATSAVRSGSNLRCWTGCFWMSWGIPARSSWRSTEKPVRKPDGLRAGLTWMFVLCFGGFRCCVLLKQLGLHVAGNRLIVGELH